MAKKHKKKKKPVGEIKHIAIIAQALFEKCKLNEDKPPLPRHEVTSEAFDGVGWWIKL
jgi:hypothetical protein